jgi:hypothetical protein
MWLPSRVLLPCMAFCLVVIAICDHFGRLSMSMPLLTCTGVFGVFIYLKWRLRRQPLFWSVIGVLVAIHLGLIWYTPWTSGDLPRAMVGGAASIDLCLMIAILATVEVLLGGGSEAEE